MRQSMWLLVILCCAAIVPVVVAQPLCSALVEDALATVAESCEGIGRNEVCYGHTSVTAYDAEETERPDFTNSGDIIPIDELANLETAPLDLDNDEWGIAILAVQADLPDTLPGQNVSIIVFGNTTIENEVLTADGDSVTLTALAQGSNVRAGAGTNFAVVDSLANGDEVVVVGRNAAADWVQIELEDDMLGWVFADLLTIEDDVSQLPLRTSNFGAPMQAFSFSTGIVQTSCDELPDDGLLIQAPQETIVHFSINGIEVEIGSTALLRTDGDTVEVYTFEGDVTITSGNVSRDIEPGFTAHVTASDTPSQAERYTVDAVRNVPVDLLPDPVDIPPPAGTDIGIVPCVFGSGGNVNVSADETLIIRLGWATQTLDDVVAFVESADASLTVDGDEQELWSRIGPGETNNGFVANWYWVLELEAGTHQVTAGWDLAHPVMSDGEEVTSVDSLICTITVS